VQEYASEAASGVSADSSARFSALVDFLYGGQAAMTHAELEERLHTDGVQLLWVVVLSFDAKGVVMRPDGLREATAKVAASQKLAGRLSKGEKRNRKRMAEVAAVYDLTPAPRKVADILPDGEQRQTARPPPTAAGKWLSASATDDAATVIAAGFDKADPDRRQTGSRWWTATRIRSTASAAKPAPAPSWPAGPGPPRSAARPPTTAWTPVNARAADTAATYLLTKKPYPGLPTALAAGRPGSPASSKAPAAT